MENFFKKKALEFIHIASLGDSILSALDFFDEKINSFIDDNLHHECIDAWFSIIINEYNLIDEEMKKLVSLSIEDTDIFASSASDVAYWQGLKMAKEC